MYWTERHVFACTGNHCNQKGAAKVVNRLRFELMRRRLNSRVMMNTCGTIDLCDIGPNVIVYPDNIVFSNVQENDVAEIVKFLEGGEMPEQLLMNAETPAEQNREAFFKTLMDAGNKASQADIDGYVEERGLDPAWIQEQLRRGFMSKKKNEESGEDVYAMTSMAARRYRLSN